MDELISNLELIAAAEELFKDDRVRQTFDLSDAEVKSLLKVKVTSTGFDVSPNFQSLGWGENDSDKLEINLSDLGNGKGVLKHELKHALHCMVCSSLFRGKDAITNFQKFVDVVINDPGFYEWRSQATGIAAETQWQKIEEMVENPSLTADEIKKNAVMLGSVLYQHAYFVDPTICEAVASTDDAGFVGFNGKLNRAVGLAFPGDQFIEGYGWKNAQEAFGKASKNKKAMMIRKQDYHRKEYFGIN